MLTGAAGYARQGLELANNPPVTSTGGFFGDFGLEIGPGFNLHVDRGGITGSVGFGLFVRADVGYAGNEKSLIAAREENKIFGSLGLGSGIKPLDIEISEAFDKLSIYADVLRVRPGVEIDRDGIKPGIKLPFGHGSAASSLKLNSDSMVFGLDVGAGWLHTLSTQMWGSKK